MRSEWKNNQGILIGTVEGEPEVSHESHGEVFYRLVLGVKRLSGMEDHLPVIVGSRRLEGLSAGAGSHLRAEGEVRSHNNRTGQGNRLQIFLFARSIGAGAEPDTNRLRLSGTLCRPPVYRRTPMGREICDLLLAVNRRCGQSDYLPCIAWGSLARDYRELEVGAHLAFFGRLQSRGYIKQTEDGPQSRTAYEISVMEEWDETEE